MLRACRTAAVQASSLSPKTYLLAVAQQQEQRSRQNLAGPPNLQSLRRKGLTLHYEGGSHAAKYTAALRTCEPPALRSILDSLMHRAQG